MKSVKRWVGVAGVGLLAMLTGAGIAMASIPGPDGMVHGCYRSDSLGSGALYVIDSADTCPNGYTALDWSQSGGVPGYEVVTDSQTYPVSTQRGSVDVACPSGKAALGGGGNASTVEISAPIVSGGSATGWTAQGRKADPSSSNPLTVTVWAVCAAVGS